MILVAGGTGRLGTRTVGRLLGRGLGVRVLTRDPVRAAHLTGTDAGTGEHGRLEVVTGDVRNPASLTPALASVGTVISAVHGLAGPGGVSPASVDRDGNANLIDAAQTVGADVVLVSMVGASADHPMELFRMKHAAEAHLHASSVGWTIVRASAFLELWIGLLQQTARRSGRPLVFGRGDNPINFVSVADVAALVDHVATDRSTRGSTLEIGGPENLTPNQLAAAVQAAAGQTAAPRHLPRPMLRLLATTMAPVKPALARQARAALAMDRIDLTFALDATALHRTYPDLPSTTLADLLAQAHTATPVP